MSKCQASVEEIAEALWRTDADKHEYPHWNRKFDDVSGQEEYRKHAKIFLFHLEKSNDV